jgi:hypothetical protein
MKLTIKAGFTYAAVIAVSFLVTGCVSPGRSKTTPAINAGKPASLAIIYVTTTNAAVSFRDASPHLNDALVSRLVESGMFATVTNQPPALSLGPGIKLTAEILHLKTVTKASRDWLGFLAGRADISLQVTITDLQSGGLIQSFQVEAESGRSAYGEMTDAVIYQAAEEVVKKVLTLNAQLAEKEGF